MPRWRSRLNSDALGAASVSRDVQPFKLGGERMSGKFLLILAAMVVAAFVAALSILSRPSNCGGNSAALAQVKHIALIAYVAAFESPSQTFRFTAPDAEQRIQLSKASLNYWIPDAHFLVSTNTVFGPETLPDQIVVVCDKPYGNVPRRLFGSAPLSYAVGFADGRSSLMSQEQFAALDLSKFVRLDRIYQGEPK
jgi:hypothetical protein